MLATVLLVLTVLVVGARPAAAHNVLLSTNPKDGSTVATTPGRVVLTFDQPALAIGSQVIVRGPTGSVSDGAPQLVDTTVSQPVTGGAPAGAYTVEWRVTSADGHPVSGTFRFTSSAAGAARVAPAAPASSAPSAGRTTAPATGSSAAPVLLAVGVLVLLSLVVGLLVRRRRRVAAREPSDDQGG